MNEPIDTDFLAKLSHELHTPLHSIYGFGNLLLKNSNKRLKEQDIYFVQRILDNCDYLFNLINTFLEFAESDLESGRELQYEDIDIFDLVNEIFHMLEVQTLEKPLILKTDISKNTPQLRTDPRKLKIILTNLISNAIKYTEKGEIIVRAISDKKKHKVKSIEVADTGQGISEKFIDRIFDPFWSHDKSRKSKSYGLGLYIAKNFCQQLGYTIEMESWEGKGSTFRIVT